MPLLCHKTLSAGGDSVQHWTVLLGRVVGNVGGLLPLAVVAGRLCVGMRSIEMNERTSIVFL